MLLHDKEVYYISNLNSEPKPGRMVKRTVIHFRTGVGIS